MAKNNIADDGVVDENVKHDRPMRSELIEDESLTGDMAALESDDDVTVSAQSMGLYPQDDGEHPQELNLAGEVMKAEDTRRGMD